ncbi:MAG TPA: mechanosensitive ion channel family protein [Mycobacteriales bacterium]|nr:mechanosensitive ion channel family protein [Mycobacteriales bacterium]
MLLAAKPKCASEAGTLCHNVWHLTSSSWLAENSSWMITKPVTILGIVFCALVVRWLLHRAIRRITKSTTEGKVPTVLRPLRERTPATIAAIALASERRRQRAQTISSVLRNVSSIAIVVVAAMMILAQLGQPLGPLLASAGIAGVALGFGAQALVKDVLAGMFMMLEDQYGVGDVIDMGDASGTVEAMGLRVTTLRDGSGVVWYVRNGEVLRVGNKSQGWAMVNVDIPVPFGTDVASATDTMRQVGGKLAEDDTWKADLLGQPEVLGVEQLTANGMTLRITVKTTSQAQWRVARELRARVTAAFAEAGIESGLPAIPTNGQGDKA